jgi:myo-inositol-1-phosphate synthase
MGTIPVGIVGVGNCASSLLQGIQFYRAGDHEPIGLMHPVLGGVRPRHRGRLRLRRVGTTLDVAALAPPNTRPCMPAPAPRSWSTA